MVMVCGEMAMSMLPLSMSSAYEGLLISAITFLRAQALGEHGREDVGFFGVRQRGEHVAAVDVLLDQQLLVGGVAVQHDGVEQQLGDRGARFGSRSMSFT